MSNDRYREPGKMPDIVAVPGLPESRCDSFGVEVTHQQNLEFRKDCEYIQKPPYPSWQH